ncbi:hypothetical protein [Rhodoblastus sp.]|uniref:hypothetical protein n=1 Tax=Rhodoblastus sp. TaxID=1962975 RepID=UPI00260BB568|nr:hypothetical protein [Rhodoblastus sp.]
MFRNDQGERRWPVLIVALALSASPVLAMLFNQALAPWAFLAPEWRNLLFLLLAPFVLGMVSETPPMLVGAREARDGSFVFAAIILIVWFMLLLKGWVLDLWANVLPFGVFVSQIGAFHAGRWAARIPRHKLPDQDGDG